MRWLKRVAMSLELEMFGILTSPLDHGITASLMLEKISKITKSNFWANTSIPTKEHPEEPLIPSTIPRMVPTPLPWGIEALGMEKERKKSEAGKVGSWERRYFLCYARFSAVSLSWGRIALVYPKFWFLWWKLPCPTPTGAIHWESLLGEISLRRHKHEMYEEQQMLHFFIRSRFVFPAFPVLDWEQNSFPIRFYLSSVLKISLE